MAAYDSLKSLVQQAIRTNGNNEITGQVLQNVLMAMIDELGGENGYAGVATPSTNPGAPDGKVFYFATEAGTYTHFDGATLAKGIHLLVFNGVTWSHQTLYTIDSEVTSGSNNLITSGAVYTKIINAINALDATVSKSAGADGLSLSLTEVDGKVTNISGSIAPQTYDAYGAASAAQIAAATDATNKVNAAKTQILGDAESDYNTLGKLEDKIQAEASRAAAAESALNIAKANKATTLAGYGINDAYTKTEVNGLVSTPHQNYVTVPTYASLPTTGSADTIYRVSNYNGSTSQVDASVYSEYAWNGSGYTFLRVVSQIGEVFDITVYNSNTKYADLAAALGTNGANVPSSIRRGGMSVKFVQSSDNKYVQYRYMGTAVTGTPNPFLNTANWQGVDDEPEPNSMNLVKSGGTFNATLFPKIVCGNANVLPKRAWRNGSPGNPSNSNYVCWNTINAASDYRNVYIHFNEDAAEGYCWYITFYQFNVSEGNPATENSHKVGENYYADTQRTNIFKIALKTTTLGYCIGVTQVLITDNTVYNPLRISTFDVNVVNVFEAKDTSKTIPEIISVLDPLVENFHALSEDVYNEMQKMFDFYYSFFRGRIWEECNKDWKKIAEENYIIYAAGTTNKGVVTKSSGIFSTVCFIPLKAGDVISGNCACYTTYCVLAIYDKNFKFVSGINSQGHSTATSVAYTATQDCYVRLAYSNASLTTAEITFNYSGFATMDKGSGNFCEGVLAYYKQSMSSFQWDNQIMKGLVEGRIIEKNLRNGSTGNGGNAYAVCTYMFDVRLHKKIKLYTNRPLTGNSYYLWNVVVSSDASCIGKNYVAVNVPSKLVNLESKASSFEVDLPDGSASAMISIVEIPNGGSAGDIVLRVSNFATYELGVECDPLDITPEPVPEAEDICERNRNKKIALTASCRYRKSSNTSKDFQLLIVTDSHGDNVCVNNSVIATNGFELIDALIHCGDLSDNISLGQNVDYLWKNIAANCLKPYYFVIGNHEAGTYFPISSSPSQEQLYNSFIKPSVDAGHLVSGEYSVGKCYYYHDFSAHNVRLIVLNEYEVPRIPKTTAYWKPITYNSGLPNYANNTAYTTGTQVNVSGYTDYSFEAVSDFNSGGFYDFKSPAVKYLLGCRWISQTQAQWFLDTLASTPSGYKIVVACHNPFSTRADVVQNVAFSQKNGWVNGQGIQNYMTNDFIADAINAYQTKSNFSTTCTSQYPNDMPSYNVSKNFSNVVGIFHSLIGGHVHQDCVWKHQTYNQYQVTPICANTNNYAQCPSADIRRPSSAVVNEIDTDCLTVVAFRPNELGLVKLGVDVTETGERRDYEVIDISGN